MSKWTFKDTKISIENGRLLNGHVLPTSHPDVNGAWGGHEAWFVEVDANNWLDEDVKLVYALVGNYWEIGVAPNDLDGPSKWEVVQALTHALRDGVSPAALLKKINEVVNNECAVCGNPVVNTYQEPALCSYHDTPPDGMR